MRLEVGRADASPIDLSRYARVAGPGDTSTWPTLGEDGLMPGEVAVVFLSHAWNSY